jgi:hypothetical protein
MFKKNCAVGFVSELAKKVDPFGTSHYVKG